jgi:hypothetical protein
MSHLVRADFGIAHLVAHGRLDGWFPRFVLGHQEFLFNGPGLTWLMALFRAVTFGALSNAGALKAVCVVSFVALPPAVGFLARSFGLGRRASGLAAVLSVLVSTPFGAGPRGLFETGLVSHQVGAVFFCLAFGAAVRATRDDRRRWIVLVAISLAALAVTHLISLLVLGVMLALTLCFLAGVRRLSRAGLLRLGVGCFGGAGLCGFWLLPFLAHRDLQGIVTTWLPPPLLRRLGAIATGDILLPAGLAVAVLAGWAYQLVRHRRDPVNLVWVAVPLVYLLVAHGAPHLVGFNGATLQLANRGLGYIGLLAVFAVATLLADGCRRWGRRGYLTVLVVTAVASAVWAPGRHSVGQKAEPIPALRAAAVELNRIVPAGARFASERDYPAEIRRTGAIHPEIWLAHASGRNSLNGFNAESSSTPRAALFMDKLESLSATRIALRLSRFGVTHVVATSDGFARRLLRSARFSVVWSASPLTILAVHPAPERPAPASQIAADGPVSAELLRADAEHLRFAIEAGGRQDVTVALGWSPKWHARLNGTAVRLRRTSDGLVQLAVPPGRSELRLDYRGDAWDRLGVLSTLVTLVAGGIALARTGRRRRPSAAPPRDS